MKPQFGEANLGAVGGAIVAAIGGLFAVGTAPAIIFRDPAVLFSMPILGVICFSISGPVGWVLGGQIGPRIAGRFGERPRIELAAGAVGGLIPVVLIALWGWYMVVHG